MSADLPQTCRIDIWLWRARFFKTRSLSAKFCETGHLRLTRLDHTQRVDKAGAFVKPDDRIVFALGARLIDITVVDMGERRGPAHEAQQLYHVNGPPDAS
ncbi:RNA-binding S4 domain-containing protein [Asticcacaulis sp. ZE23SCel15]|uniref:RNA-binding S4 domain-containing protein n=1 Tax=Asticcacaulis sp. ZE23SCel15 TaxID=3059027 RepID=UPI00265E33E5|nr:RNA-binding S4 domain-containing protein [Asticcacaulis sp. ZE23SCel15]WKL57147.1 RNA-binding S4 domain-containing protein [Asticcacaulis sp. ZE23SCel15]